MCFSIYHEIADEYLNIVRIEGTSFTYNVGKAKSYYYFNCWLYCNTKHQKIDPENELETLD